MIDPVGPILTSSSHVLVWVGGEGIINALSEPDDSPWRDAADRIRRTIERTGATRSRVLLSTDGLGLVIEGHIGESSFALVWSNWTRDEPPEQIDGATSCAFVSPSHFIYRIGDEWMVSQTCNATHVERIDPLIDTDSLRILPTLGRWVAVEGQSVLVGTMPTVTRADAAAAHFSPSITRLAAFHDSSWVLVETEDERIHALGVSGQSKQDLSLSGQIDWPYSIDSTILVVVRGEGGSVSLEGDGKLLIDLHGAGRRRSKGAVMTRIEAIEEAQRDYRGIPWPPHLLVNGALRRSHLDVAIVPYLALVPRDLPEDQSQP